VSTKKTTKFPAQEINEIANLCKGFISSLERLKIMQKAAKKFLPFMPMSDNRVVILCGIHLKMRNEKRLKSVIKRK